jgi:hypothetical protein
LAEGVTLQRAATRAHKIPTKFSDIATEDTNLAGEYYFRRVETTAGTYLYRVIGAGDAPCEHVKSRIVKVKVFS